MIDLKRAYEPPSPRDGYRVLVERLWPRGVKKEALHLDEWARPIAPSAALRKWYGHDPDRWNGFVERYRHELDASPEAQRLLDQLGERARHGRVTLVFAAHDPSLSNARVVQEILEERVRAAGAPQARPAG